MRRLRWSCGMMLAGFLLVFSGSGAAQEKSEPDGSKSAVPRGFRMYLIADGRFEVEALEKKDPEKKAPLIKEKDIRIRIGKLHDPVSEIGLNTVIAAFVRAVPKDEKGPAIPMDANDPAVTVLKFEQDLAKKYRTHRVGAFLAFLALSKDFAEDDARYARMKEVEAFAKAVMVPLVQIGFAEADSPQVTAWGIAPDDSITIVLYHRFKIVKRWQFKADAPPTAEQLKEISNKLDVVMGKNKE